MSYVRVEYPKIQVFDGNGVLGVGYEVYAYTAGTSNACNTYSDRALTTPNTWPVVCNARGEADIYVGSAVKLILTIPGGDPGSPIWTVDYVAEEQSTYYTGASVTTSANVAVITGNPTASALTANMMLVYIPDADNTETMGATGYSVAGPNDCKFDGPYTTGTTSSSFRVEIDGEDVGGGADTFLWRKDAEADTTGVAITGDWQTLKEGISVRFSVLIGHTTGDYWTQAVTPPYKINLDGLGAKTVYKNSGGTLVPLESGDIKNGYPAVVVYTNDAKWLLINTADFTAEAEAATDRYRYEKVAAYTLKDTDHGNEISFTSASDLTLTLPAAATLANKFFYISACGSGNVTIDADGTEVIKSPRVAAGAGTYLMEGNQNHAVQIATNGVDWHIMTETRGNIKQTVVLPAASPYTFTPDVDTKYVWVRGISGGGGAGVSTTGGVPSGGGQGGGYFEKMIAKASLGATETVTVGAGGLGCATGAAGNGVAGNTTSFGAHASATGGGGGTSTAGGTGGGIATGGDINIGGMPGIALYDNVYLMSNGGGAGGPFGGNEALVNVAAGPFAGPNGVAYGGGGGGGYTTSGGNGADGIVVIWEFK